MAFVNPILLAGTALVALPIVLHLIMRQKPRQFEFPALRFLAQRHDTNQRRLRLRHLVLLALRVALIALLAFALARPSIRFTGALGSQEAPVAAALVFDTSMRMDYRHENRTRLEAEQHLGQWLLAQFPRESQIAVLDTRRAPAAFSVDRGAAKHRIERLTTTANSEPVTTALGDALQLLGQSELARKEVYVFTDLSRASWPLTAAAGLQERMAQLHGVGVYVIDVGVKDPIDFALTDARPVNQVLSSRSPLRIDTQVQQTGPGGTRTIELYLLGADRKPEKRSEQTVTLSPGQSQALQFQIGALDLGTHQGYLQILGQDGLAADDRRFFTVEVKPPWRVLIVAPSPTDATAVYLTEAIAPTAFRSNHQARFEPTVIGYDKLAKQPLDTFSAVCLLDPAPMDGAVWQKLANYASDGHGVAIFLGRHAQPVDTFNQKTAQQVLPGKLIRRARRPDGDAYLAPRNQQHPILNTFRSYAGQVPWDAFPVFQYWQLGDVVKGVDAVVPYNDGQPAILDRPVGKGHVLTMTTSISDDPNDNPWSLLPAGDAWPFMILVNEMMSYLVGSAEQQLNYYAGQTAVIELDPAKAYPAYALTEPDGTEVRVNPDSRQNVLVVTEMNQPGNYRIQAGGAGGVDRGFSVNLAPGQTELARLDEKQLAEIFGKYPYRVAREESQIEREFTTGRVGRELFPLVIVLVVVVLGLEHIVANRFYKQ